MAIDRSVIFGKRLARMRKNMNLTQEQLATAIGVSYQAVSKWETGRAYPDIELLPIITDVLETNIDTLLGHIPGDIKKSVYENVYIQEEFYWGLNPANMCYEILKIMPPNKPYKLLEIGCGEGKDALFFARNGYDVTAFDISQSGVDKANWLAEKFHVNIKAFRADMLEYRVTEPYDIIYSSRSMHHIRSDLREEIIHNYQENTTPYGINAFDIYVAKPFIKSPPDTDTFSFLWKSGEILMMYADWEIWQMEEKIYDCTSSGKSHQHAVNRMIARKYST